MSAVLMISVTCSILGFAFAFLGVGVRTLPVLLGFWLLGLVLLFHVLSELPQGHVADNPYRRFVSLSQIDDWILTSAAALLAFACGYGLLLRRRQLSSKPPGERATKHLGVISQRTKHVLLGSTAFLYVAVLAIEEGFRPTSSVAYFIDGILGPLLLPTLIFTLLLTANSGSQKRQMLLIGLLAVLLFPFGNRLLVLSAVAMWLYGRSYLGRPLGLRVVAWGALILIVSSLAVEAVRVDSGRGVFQAGGLSRILEVPSATVEAIAAPSDLPGIDEQIIRLDGNSYPAIILALQESGRQPIGLSNVPNSLYLAVPRFLNPNKYASPASQRNEEAFIRSRYEYGPLGRLDFLPTQFGALLAMFGAGGLVLATFTLGSGVATLDNRLLRRPSLTKLFVGLFVLSTIASYEKGIENYFVSFRVLLVVLIGTFMFKAFKRMGVPRQALHFARRAQTKSARPTSSLGAK